MSTGTPPPTSAARCRPIKQLITDGKLQLFDKVGVAYMLRDVSDYDAATGKILKRAFPPHIMIYAPGITAMSAWLAGPRLMICARR